MEPITIIVASLVTPVSAKPVFKQLDQHQPDHGSEDAAFTAEDAGSAQHDSGDSVQLEPRSHVAAGGSDSRDEDNRRRAPP